MIRPLVLCLALAPALPSFGAVGPEIPLSTMTIQPAAKGRGGPRIASNGSGFLVVWYDELGSGIRGARLDRNGALIEERSIRIASSTGPHVAVASDGADYVVAYDCGARPNPRTCVSRVLSQNGLVEPPAIVEGAMSSAIASNGRSYLLVYDREPPAGSGFGSLAAVAISRDARTVGRPVQLSGTAFDVPDVASDGDKYFVVWSSYRALLGAVVSASGEPGPAQQLTHTIATRGASAFRWSVASNGKGFLVVWQQNVGVKDRDYVTELRTCPISAEGVAGGERTIVAGAERTSLPRAAWSGSAYEVTYTRAGSSLWPFYFRPPAADIHRVTVDETGQLVGGPVAVTDRPGLQLLSDIASNGRATVVTWERESRGGAVEIEAKVLPDAAPFIVSNGPAWQQSVAGTMSGDIPLVTWEELVGPLQRREVALQRLSPEATPVDGRGIVAEPSSNDQLFPAVTPLFIAWLEQPIESSGQAFAVARRLEPDGRPIGPLLRLGDASRDGRVALATGRSQSLFAWRAPEGGLVGVLVSNGGAVLDPAPFAISPATAGDGSPIVATDGNDFLVAWQRPENLCVFECVPPSSLHAARVTAQRAAGPVLDIAPADASNPEIVWNGNAYVVFWSGVVWEQSIDWVTRVRARSISRDGMLSSEPARVIADGVLRGARWSDEHFVVAFDQARLRDSGAASSVGWFDRDLRPTRLVSAGPPFGAAVALLPENDETLIAAYPRVGITVDATSRAVARIIDDSPTIRRRATRSR